MKFHKDGRLFIADYRKGLLSLDTKSAKLETVLETAYSEGFKGLNGLHFTSAGDIAFGGPDRKTVYITDSLSGDVLKAQSPVAGKLLYGLS